MPTPRNPNDPGSSGPQLPRIPEMVGATAAPFDLGATTTVITLPIQPPTGPALIRADGKPRRVFLNIEHLRSDLEAPSYEVYMNLPSDSAPERHSELRVCHLAMFGLIESSRPRGGHPGNGLTYKFEVTRIYASLIATKQWNAKELRVSFVPEPWPVPAKVQVGRVSLYFE